MSAGILTLDSRDRMLQRLRTCDFDSLSTLLYIDDFTVGDEQCQRRRRKRTLLCILSAKYSVWLCPLGTSVQVRSTPYGRWAWSIIYQQCSNAWRRLQIMSLYFETCSWKAKKDFVPTVRSYLGSPTLSKSEGTRTAEHRVPLTVLKPYRSLVNRQLDSPIVPWSAPLLYVSRLMLCGQSSTLRLCWINSRSRSANSLNKRVWRFCRLSLSQEVLKELIDTLGSQGSFQTLNILVLHPR